MEDISFSTSLTVDDESVKPASKQPPIDRTSVKPHQLAIHLEESLKPAKHIPELIPLHEYCEQRIAYVVFTISPCAETSYTSLNARLTLKTGIVALSILNESNSIFSDNLHIELVKNLQLLNGNRLFQSLRDILSLFWDSSLLHFADKMLDPQWKLAVSGRPAKQDYRQAIPREAWSPMTLTDSASSFPRTRRDNRGRNVDWQNRRLILGDGSIWHDVKVSINFDGAPTPKQERQNRLDNCKRRLLEFMRAHPQEPKTKDQCWTTLRGEIEFLSNGEFDLAWSSAIQVAHAENPKSKWGRPGAPRRALSVRRHRKERGRT